MSDCQVCVGQIANGMKPKEKLNRGEKSCPCGCGTWCCRTCARNIGKAMRAR